MKSPFRYPGGKFYALKLILPYITACPHVEFREPFVGGGTIFFGKQHSKINWINDLETELVNVYQVIADRTMVSELVRLVSKETASRERHTEVKNMHPKDKLGRAFKTYYLNRTSYSGIVHKPAWGYADGKSSPPKNWGSFLRDAHTHLKGVKITSVDFTEVVATPAISKPVLMYLDPPYFHADQKRAYTKPFELEDHIRLEKSLKRTKHSFCLSYDDCPEIRKLYSWANIYAESWLYNTANKKDEKRSMGHELIISNYKVKPQRQLSLFNLKG